MTTGVRSTLPHNGGQRLQRRGATIDVRTLPGVDHVNSWIQALPRAVRWFHAIE